jgi:threonine dehydrogenase-like Zn-dependent dehydrogenase
MTYQEAALTKPLGAAIYVVKTAEIRQGDTVAVIGSGPLGLMLARLVHLQGARVILAGKGDGRLEQAREFGARVDRISVPKILPSAPGHVKI